MSDYFEKKFDEGKQKALFPVEVLPHIFDNKNHFAKLINELVSFDIEEIVQEVEEVLQYGAEKYKPNSWQTVPDARERYWNAYMRHMLSENISDEESGLPHRSHKLCNLVFLLWFEVQKDEVTLLQQMQDTALELMEHFTKRDDLEDKVIELTGFILITKDWIQGLKDEQ